MGNSNRLTSCCRFIVDKFTSMEFKHAEVDEGLGGLPHADGFP
jgi:hypothetical protein